MTDLNDVPENLRVYEGVRPSLPAPSARVLTCNLQQEQSRLPIKAATTAFPLQFPSPLPAQLRHPAPMLFPPPPLSHPHPLASLGMPILHAPLPPLVSTVDPNAPVKRPRGRPRKIPGSAPTPARGRPKGRGKAKSKAKRARLSSEEEDHDSDAEGEEEEVAQERRVLNMEQEMPDDVSQSLGCNTGGGTDERWTVQSFWGTSATDYEIREEDLEAQSLCTRHQAHW